MKDSQVYLKAAEIAQDWGFPSCSAVATVTGEWWDTSDQAKRYAAFFRPYKNSPIKWGEQWGDTREEVKSCRVLALLFMHQIALDEEQLTRRTFKKVTGA